MRKHLIILPLFALSLAGCGYSVSDAVDDIKGQEGSDFADGQIISTAATQTGSFTKVKALGPDNIIFVTGSTTTIKAEGNAEAIATLRYKLEDGAIIIGRKNGKWFGDEGKGVTITITAPSLSEASLAGSGDFAADKMSGDNVEVKIAGSGNLKVGAVTAKTLTTKIAGSGDAMLAGTATSVDFSVLGSGNIDAQQLKATDAEVSIAGSGDVRVNATGQVEAKVAGSGDINVTGGAKCTSKSMGSGSISCS